MKHLQLHTRIETWEMKTRMKIAGYIDEVVRVLIVSVESDGFVGMGEAAGIYYEQDNADSMCWQVESLRSQIESGIERCNLGAVLPAGGARNALDCALWDLEAKREGNAVWRVAGLKAPRPLLTTFTCGADDPEKMAEAAAEYTGAKAIKIKLTGEDIDLARVRAVREARSDVWLTVDANQGLSRSSFERLMPALVDARVALIEQPFVVASEPTLVELCSPIPVAADESVKVTEDLSRLVGRFHVVNIKLDKCGGLTEALRMAERATALGFTVMVGNMGGTSLAMAPAYLVGQLCKFVDLDGPLFLKEDRKVAVRYEAGMITCSEEVWGGTATPTSAVVTEQRQ